MKGILAVLAISSALIGCSSSTINVSKQGVVQATTSGAVWLNSLEAMIRETNDAVAIACSSKYGQLPVEEQKLLGPAGLGAVQKTVEEAGKIIQTVSGWLPAHTYSWTGTCVK